MKKNNPTRQKYSGFIELTSNEIETILDNSDLCIPNLEKKTSFEDELNSLIYFYCVNIVKLRRQPDKKVINNLNIIVKATNQINDAFKCDGNFSVNPVVGYLSKGASEAGLEHNYNDEKIWDYMDDFNVSAKKALKYIGSDDDRKTEIIKKPINTFIIELSHLWYNRFEPYPTSSVDGPLAKFINNLLSKMAEHIKNTNKLYDPKILKDLSLSEDAIQHRLRDIPLVKFRAKIVRHQMQGREFEVPKPMVVLHGERAERMHRKLLEEIEKRDKDENKD